MNRKIIYIHLDTIINFEPNMHFLKEDNPDELEYYEEAARVLLKPSEKALNSINFLQVHFDIYIVASPKELKDFRDKIIWIKNNLPEFESRLILTTHTKLLKGDYFITPYPSTFQGQQIHYGHKQFQSGWSSVLQHLCDEAGIDYPLDSKKCDVG